MVHIGKSCRSVCATLDRVPTLGRNRRRLLASAAVAGLGLLASTAELNAATFTWDKPDADGDWETGLNWVDDVAPPTNDSTTQLVFPADADGGAITYGASYTLNAVTFAGPSVTLNASAGSLGLTFDGTNPTILKDADARFEFGNANGSTITFAQTTTIGGSAPLTVGQEAANALVFTAPIVGAANVDLIKAGAYRMHVADRAGFAGTIQVNDGQYTTGADFRGALSLNGDGGVGGKYIMAGAYVGTAASLITLAGGGIEIAVGSTTNFASGSTLTAEAGTTSTIRTTGAVTIRGLGDTTDMALAGTGTITKIGTGGLRIDTSSTSWNGQWDVAEGSLTGGNLALNADTDVMKNIHVRDTGRFYYLASNLSRTFNGRLTGVSSTANNTDGIFTGSGAIAYNIDFGASATVSPGGMANGSGNFPNESAALKWVATRQIAQRVHFLSGSTLRADITSASTSDRFIMTNNNASTGSRGNIGFLAGSKLEVVLFQGKTDIIGGSWRIAEATSQSGTGQSTISGVAGLSSNTTYKTQAGADANAAGSGWSGFTLATADFTGVAPNPTLSQGLIVTGSYKAADASITAPESLVRVLVGGAAAFNVNVANADDDGAANLDGYTISGANLVSASGTGLAEGANENKSMSFGPSVVAGAYAPTLTLTALTSPDATDSITAEVLDHSNSSFSADSDVNNSSLPTIVGAQNTGFQTSSFNVYNLEATVDYTAALDRDSIVITAISGSTSVLTIDDTGFDGLLAAGSFDNLTARLDTSAGIGTYSAVYQLTFSDENLPGAASSSIMVTLNGQVIVPEPASLSWVMGLSLFALRRRRRQHA